MLSIIRVVLQTNESTGIKLLSSDVSSLNFNGVASGETLEQTFNLTSNGTDAVNVTGARFMEGSDEGVFTFGEELSGTNLMIRVLFRFILLDQLMRWSPKHIRQPWY